MLREALPLSVGLGMAVLYTRVDALMLSKMVGFESVAIYGVAYKFIDVLHFAATAVTVPLLTLLVRRWPHEPADFRADLQRAATVLALVGGAGLWCCCWPPSRSRPRSTATLLGRGRYDPGTGRRPRCSPLRRHWRSVR